MAKVTIVGNAVIVESQATLEDLKLVEKYRPEALTLFGGEDGKDPIFKVGTDGCSINQYGAEFNSVSRNGDGKATITAVMPSCIEDAKEYVSEKFGVALLHLTKIEAALPAAIAEIKAEKEVIAAKITVQ